MSPRMRHADLLLTAAFAALLVSAGCAPNATKSETPSRTDTTRKGGSGGQGTDGSGGTGNGGSNGSAGAGGNSGSAGAGGSPAANSDGGVAAGPVVPLPVVVTRHFDNQGWFADPALEMKFMPGSTIIRHGVNATGLCGPGRSMPAPKGDCLKVIYTPPDGVVPPAMGGWVGVFLLTTLLDPSVVGQPNWGVSGEAGKNIAAGASTISFLAASDSEGQQVVFKAGTKSDSFIVEDVPQTLSTGWKPFSIPLGAAGPYGNNVYGGFAWVLTDTTKPATFYIDGIVWE